MEKATSLRSGQLRVDSSALAEPGAAAAAAGASGSGAAALGRSASLTAAQPGPGTGKLFNRLQDVPLTEDEYGRPLPLGPADLLNGTLANGLQYYVRPCRKPSGRAALALAVKVGSVQEEDHEQGVAHIVEHLAFNATDRFQNHELVRFLESIGAQFGACQNATTSSDETIYELIVPTVSSSSSSSSDKGGGKGAGRSAQRDAPAEAPATGQETLALLQQALDVLAQFAVSIRCAEGDLAKERGAVLEEWRMSRDAVGRAQEAHWRLIMQGSKYADRLPIGKESIVRTVPAATVKAFYERWYKPDRMAVVVVGDFSSGQAVVDLVRAAFEPVQSRDPGPAPPLVDHPHAPHAQPRYQVFTDRETQSPTVFVSFKTPRPALSSPKDFLHHLETWLLQEVINTRLFKLSREEDPPLLSGGVSDESLTRVTSSVVLSASALEGGVLRALETLLLEVARIRLHGITPRELSHAIADFKSDVEATWRERDQSYCWDVRDEYVRHFFHREFCVGQEYEARLSKTLLARVTKEAVEAQARLLHPGSSCVIKVVEHGQTVTEAQLAACVERVRALEEQGAIEPWSDAVLPETLLPHNLQPLTPEQGIVSERHYELLGATEFRLSNGMTVYLKQTSFLEDELLMTGCAAGGLSEVPRELHYTCACAPVVAGQLGVYGIKPTVLNDFLAGTRVDASTSEGAFSRTFSSSQSPEDLDVALQLVHALFTTNVQEDPKELRVVVQMLHESVEAQRRNPLTTFHTRVRQVNYGDLFYFRPLTHKDVTRVDMRAACEHFSRCFRNPAEFKVVFTGNVSREQLLPLVLKYLATLPASDDPKPRSLSDVTPLQWQGPTAPVVEDVPVAMVSPITQAQLTFPVTLSKETGREDVVWLALACRLLETRVLQRLRFEWGEVYTCSVAPFFGCEAPSNKGAPRGDVSVSFTCDPANRRHCLEMALEELESMQAGRITEEELRTAIHLEELQLQEEAEENSFWHDVAVSGYQSKSFLLTGDLDQVHQRTLNARAKVFAEASPPTLQAALLRIFPNPCRSCYTALSMVPREVPPWLRLPRQLLSGLVSHPGLRSPWAVAGLLAVAAGATAAWLAWRSSSSSSSRSTSSHHNQGATKAAPVRGGAAPASPPAPSSSAGQARGQVVK